MTAHEIDEYLAVLPDLPRATLTEMRRRILDVVPEAEQGLSYGIPAFRVDGKLVAGFGAYAKHLTYVPHSGSVLEGLVDKLVGYKWSKGSVQFPLDQPMPEPLIHALIEARLAEMRG